MKYVLDPWIFREVAHSRRDLLPEQRRAANAQDNE